MDDQEFVDRSRHLVDAVAQRVDTGSRSELQTDRVRLRKLLEDAVLRLDAQAAERRGAPTLTLIEGGG
jgi:hypothetical protein